MNDFRVQSKFKRYRHDKLTTFIISEDYYELSKRTTRYNGKIYHIFKPNNFRDGRNLYQGKASMDMTFNELKNLFSTGSNEKNQPLAIDLTKNKNTGRYRLGLSNLFVPDTNPFWIRWGYETLPGHVFIQ